MDSTLFEEWVRELDCQFEKESQKVALIVDNCTAHPEIGGLKAIDLFFLPPNTTSILQPMDQGVIRSLKARYRTKVVKKMIEAIDSNKPLPDISLLDAMKMLVLAWNEVTDTIVQNCFRKAGLVRLQRKMQYQMIHSPYLNQPSRNSLILMKHTKISLLRMLHLLMTCLCQHKSLYLMKKS